MSDKAAKRKCHYCKRPIRKGLEPLHNTKGNLFCSSRCAQGYLIGRKDKDY